MDRSDFVPSLFRSTDFELDYFDTNKFTELKRLRNQNVREIRVNYVSVTG